MSDQQTATVVMSASTRRGSINGALARRIVEEVTSRGGDADLVDLTEYDMPMYHGDLEADEGVPASAVRLAARLADADHLMIVSPEYNGAFPPLLKNTVDWLTRVDRAVLAHLEVSLASATPGGSGGQRMLGLLRTWMQHMRVDVSATSLSVPFASLDDDGELTSDESIDLDAFFGAAVS